MSSSNDPTRPVQRGAAEPAVPGTTPPAEPPASGPAGPTSSGPAPGEDAPRTGKRAATPPAPGPQPSPESDVPSGGHTAGLWISLIVGAIVLILLLIFVIQNQDPAQFQYFGAEFDLPLGVAMLLAAIAGALVMALVGSVRMVQMSWANRKLRKQLAKIQRTVG